MASNNPVEKLRELEGRLESYGNGVYAPRYPELKGVADGIEATYMKLPVDADGVPICIGDEVKLHEKGANLTVRGVGVNSAGNPVIWGVRELNTQTTRHRVTDEITHVKPDTVESLLEELALSHEWGELGMIGNSDEMDEVIADYAERIRKAVQHEG